MPFGLRCGKRCIGHAFETYYPASHAGREYLLLKEITNAASGKLKFALDLIKSRANLSLSKKPSAMALLTKRVLVLRVSKSSGFQAHVLKSIAI